jgi:hypothetical protein
MNLATNVERGLQILAEFLKLKEELAAITAAIEAEALLGDQVELNDADREGRQFIAKGIAHQIPVVFTADSIVGQFQDGCPMHARLTEIAGDNLKNFFKKKTIWENNTKSGKQFRSLAKSILEDKAPEFISGSLARDKDGIPKSSIKIEWDRVEDINP